MKLRRSKTLHETVELNITAFLNLMVILVPFLLITAVFSRMTVLELTLPQLAEAEAQAPDEKIDLQLQMIVQKDYLEVRDATIGRLKKFDITGEAIEWQPVADLLVAIKTRYPEETAISLLLGRDVPYKTLIDTMDHVRSAQIVNVTTLEEVELFPAVSIGDAPQMTEGDEAEADASLDDLPAGGES